MIGPVLRQEMLLGSRRHKLHVFRWVFAAYLAFLVIFFYLKFQLFEPQRSRACVAGMRRRAVGLALVPRLPSLWGASAASVLASVLCRRARDAVLGLCGAAVVAWVVLYLFGIQAVFAPDSVIGPVWGQRGAVGLA